MVVIQGRTTTEDRHQDSGKSMEVSTPQEDEMVRAKTKTPASRTTAVTPGGVATRLRSKSTQKESVPAFAPVVKPSAIRREIGAGQQEVFPVTSSTPDGNTDTTCTRVTNGDASTSTPSSDGQVATGVHFASLNISTTLSTALERLLAGMVRLEARMSDIENTQAAAATQLPPQDPVPVTAAHAAAPSAVETTMTMTPSTPATMATTMVAVPPAPPGADQPDVPAAPIAPGVPAAPDQPAEAAGSSGVAQRARNLGTGTAHRRSPSPSGSDSSSSDSDSDYGTESSPSDSSSSSSEGHSSSSHSSGSDDEEARREQQRRHRERRERRHRRHHRGRRDDDEPLDVRRRRHRRRERRRRRRVHFKDLEIAPFKPSPMESVSTWISKVDLALEGARYAERGVWSDRELYYRLGNKLQGNAAKWFVQMNQELRRRERTWTRLKSALTRRYGERPDKSAAEWRVSQRRMMPGETYADFAAGLRDLTGQNRISERVLLAQFYRNLDKTTRQLVRLHPKPKRLEDAVDKATKIDDPMGNVAQGMQNIGQPWATAPNSYFIPMEGTTGQLMIAPGVGGARADDARAATMADNEMDLAFFTNPQGVWNKFTGTWDVPGGRVWNGRYWARTSKKQKQRPEESRDSRHGKRAVSKLEKKAKVMMAKKTDSSSSEESDAPPPPPKRKKHKAVVRQTKPVESKPEAPEQPVDKRPSEINRCYACGGAGHFAKECPDAAARERNNQYLAARQARQQPQENADRT